MTNSQEDKGYQGGEKRAQRTNINSAPGVVGGQWSVISQSSGPSKIIRISPGKERPRAKTSTKAERSAWGLAITQGIQEVAEESTLTAFSGYF